MNDFDQYVKQQAEKEKNEIPESVKNKIEQTLAQLPEKENKMTHIRLFPRVAAAAACVIFVMVFLLPNVSSSYAHALEQVPVIGSIIRVITVRNYFYSDQGHEMNISVPEIEGTDSDAVDDINNNINELTYAVVNQFYKDLEATQGEGYGAVNIGYTVQTNTRRWFTMKISVTETAASSNRYYVFYHIDKETGKIVKLSDLFKTDRYCEILISEIKKQMESRMASDENVKYWINDSEIGEDFVTADDSRNFYWNKNGDLVLVFDKYEVGPGSTGTPEFTVGKEVIKDILKPEYLNMTF